MKHSTLDKVREQLAGVLCLVGLLVAAVGHNGLTPRWNDRLTSTPAADVFSEQRHARVATTKIIASTLKVRRLARHPCRPMAGPDVQSGSMGSHTKAAASLQQLKI